MESGYACCSCWAVGAIAFRYCAIHPQHAPFYQRQLVISPPSITILLASGPPDWVHNCRYRGLGPRICSGGEWRVGDHPAQASGSWMAPATPCFRYLLAVLPPSSRWLVESASFVAQVFTRDLLPIRREGEVIKEILIAVTTTLTKSSTTVRTSNSWTCGTGTKCEIASVQQTRWVKPGRPALPRSKSFSMHSTCPRWDICPRDSGR
jgi:hypothetical protein